MLKEMAFACRTLVQRPGYALSIILTLAIGIGATTLMFSLVDAALIRPLPFADSGRLVLLNGVAGPQRAPRGGSVPEVLDWREMNASLQDVSIYNEFSLNMQSGHETSRVEAELVSASYFPLLGAQPAVGRTFTAEEDAVPDKYPVAVISDALWRRAFSADANILQRTITLNDRALSVVGVMPRGFNGVSFDTDVWVPSAMLTLATTARVATDRSTRWLLAVARLKDGVSLETSRRDLDRVAAALEQQYPASNRQRGVQIDTLQSAIIGDARGLLLALLGGVGLFLIVACANVASLQLARAMARRREMAVRLALGATRIHLLRQLSAEALVLAIAAGYVGSIGAAWALSAVISLFPAGAVARIAQASVDPRAMGVALAVSFLAAAAVSILPGFTAARSDLSGTMKEGGRAAEPGLASLRRPSVQQGLVVAEIALAMTLLTAAGLMIRSLDRRSAVPLGFERNGVTIARLSLPAIRFGPDQRRSFVDRLETELARLPLVQHAAIASSLPFTGNTSASTLVPDTATTAEQAQRYYRNFVTPGFFETLGIPITRGRAFNTQDVAGAPAVAIINEGAAKRLWGDVDPIGRQFRLGNLTGAPVQIVGVARDARFRDLTTDLSGARVEPDVYFPFAQRTDSEIEIAVRTADGSHVPAPALLHAVQTVDASLPLYLVRPLNDVVRAQNSTARFGSTLFGVFSTGALLLAAIGLYGLISYVVGLSRREIAIRLALGADARRVVVHIVGNGMSVVAVGVVLGTAGAFVAGRAMRAQLFQTAPLDPLTLGSVAGLLLLVAVLAAYIPSRRASHIEPHAALRSQ
jgi:putative ABC transport system permease protein